MISAPHSQSAPHRISVIVPVLNAGRFLEESLSSVRNQQGAGAELIVVDDGSTDNSAEVAGRFADVVLHTRGREGPSHARNLGAAAAKGSLLAFLDADDMWLPDHLTTAAAALDGAPQASLVFSQVQGFGADSYTSNAGADIPGWKPFDARVPLMQRNLVTQITVVVRRDAFESVGGYDAGIRYAEDFDLWHRLAARSPFVHVPKVTARYRVHAEQASAATSTLLQSAWEVRLRNFAALCASDRNVAAEAAPVLANAWRAEMTWTVKMGERDLHASFTAMHPRVVQLLEVNGFTAPQAVPWSPLRADWHRLKRRVRALVAPGRAG